MRLMFNKKRVYISLTIVAALLGISIFAFFWLHKPPTTNAVSKVIDESILLTNKRSIRLVHATKPEKGLLIYLADMHSNKAANDYAKKFADLSYYVAMLDSQTLLKSLTRSQSGCVNIAEKIMDISKELQTTYDIDDDNLPILVGDNTGAALVYIALMQADQDYFHAGISINFAPKFPPNMPFCSAPKDTNNNTVATGITPIKHLPASWYIFQDQNISQNADTKAFAYKVRNARLTIANETNETSLTEAIQILQWLDPRLTDQVSSDNSDSDLPLIEVPVEKTVAEKTPKTQAQSTTLAILLTGDGGWAEIDKSVAKILAEKGIPTVALDSLSYFWRTRTPEETAKDIEDTITQYREKWNKQNVILIGYSFGADVLPFIANKLTPEMQKNISLVALLGMGKTAAFKFHLSSWLNADKDPSRLPLLPELKNMTWANSICIYGVDDEESNCSKTAELGLKVISMSGDHHFDEKYDELVQHIIDNIKVDDTLKK